MQIAKSPAAAQIFHFTLAGWTVANAILADGRWLQVRDKDCGQAFFDLAAAVRRETMAAPVTVDK